MADLFAALKLEPLPNGKHWRVARDWFIRGHTIQEGFVTDFASIPRPLWWLLPRWGKYGPGAIFHDYLYRVGCTNRKEADVAFAEVMAECQVSRVWIFLIYTGVRLFGFRAWRRRRRQQRGGQ